MTDTTVPAATFTNLGIAPKILDILEKNKFTIPTPIQAQSIPPATEGKDLIGIAQTGTGKTLAFGIPMIQRLAQAKGLSKGLIILPTRELALQVDQTLQKIGGPLGMKTAILIGGESMVKQFKALKRDPHVIVATPGRLIDHLDNNKLKLDAVSILVLDEADRMLDMGFAPQINKILQRVPKKRQTMLFSATMPNEIVKIAQSYMQTPLRIEVAPAGSAVKSVTQELFFVEKSDKLSLLKSILTKYDGSVLVFSRTKHGAKKIAHSVVSWGHSATEIHSNRSLSQRISSLDGFKLGKYRVMIATDIAARGIDVTGIQLVVNFDLPATAEDYVHRIGRTGRAGMTGHAISFASSDQRGDVRSIERLIKKTLAVSKTPELEKLPGQERTRGDYGNDRTMNRGRFSRDSRISAPRGRDSGPRSRSQSPARSSSYAPASSSSRYAPSSSPSPSASRDGGKPRNTRGGFSKGGRNSRDRKREPEYKKPSRPVYQGDGGYFMTRHEPSSSSAE